jgi:hypothetical protein
MLDYAANGTEYWPIDKLRQYATETAQQQGQRRLRNKTISFPLSEIEPVKQTGHNAEWVVAYKLWSQ